jgi:hypothetical protein
MFVRIGYRIHSSSMRHRPIVLVSNRQWNSNISDVTSPSTTNTNTTNTTSETEIVYEGPFAMLTTRLKGVSLASASLGCVIVPLLLHTYSGEISILGQYAVGGMTMMIATITTVTVNYCFSPYVHTLERIPALRLGSSPQDVSSSEDTKKELVDNKYLIKSTRRNFLLMKKEMVFDPSTDCEPYKGYRPFCNFLANKVPHYIHPEALLFDDLRKHLLGEVEAKKYDMPNDRQRREDADEFL